MAATLTIQNNQANNPLSLTLSPYMDPTEGKGLDPADPQFTNRVWSRSLLKTGATLALEQLTEKELTFPLHIGPVRGQANAPTNMSQTLLFIQQINEIIETPGATLTWQPAGASQPTTFDILNGLFEVEYSYWAEAQFWTSGLLRVFTQPLGRAAGPRLYASASGVGPLLMISPYASSGAQAVGASTQAGVAGFGGQQQGASSGVFYWGSPSLAGDAPAQLQISYTGPLPNTSSNTGCVPYTMVSLLPDSGYQPLITPAALMDSFSGGVAGAASLISNQTAIASQYVAFFPNSANALAVAPLFIGNNFGFEPTNAWAGQHRLLAIAKASSTTQTLQTLAGPLVGQPTGASVAPGADWGLYDLGTFALRASEPPSTMVTVQCTVPSGALSVAGLVMLPDNATWFLNPTGLTPSSYGWPVSAAAFPVPYTNTLILDDVLGDQFIYNNPSQTSAPPPTGEAGHGARVTPFSRGLLPLPDPKNGIPIIAIVGVAQNSVASLPPGNGGLYGALPGASWNSPQNLRTMAQISVLERTRYMFG